MQIKALHKNVYRLYAWARTQETLAAHRARYQQRVMLWPRCKAKGLSDADCADLCGFSRASYFRAKAMLALLAKGKAPPSKARKRQNRPKWGEAERQLVLSLRRQNPTYGKDKLAVIVKRDHGLTISTSTVGRILGDLKGRGLITRSASCPRSKRRRSYQTHAKPWEYKDYQDMVLGERVQIDHMTATKNGVVMKHFQAWERKSKHLHAQLYGHAKATSAKRFLEDLIAKAPYEISSIQVDGGSEFMAEFEQACASYDIPLIVLPPAKPKYNGGIERSNRTLREEFYAQPSSADSIGAFRYELTNALHKYNSFRPHMALKGLTPLQFLASQQSAKPCESIESQSA